MPLIIDTNSLEFAESVEEILEQCILTVKYMLTQSEIEQIQNIDDSDNFINDYIQFFLVSSTKSCIEYSKPEDSLTYVATNYPAIVELSVLYLRDSLTSRSISENGNGSIKSISSSGRSVTFMSAYEIGASGIPESIKSRLPKPKAKVRVW